MVGVKSAEGESARPGADEPVIRRRRGQESPIPRDEHDISRKAIAQGMSDCLRCPVRSCALFFCAFCTRDRGCSAHPAFPAPSCLRDNETQTSGRSCRENADVYVLVELNYNSHSVIARRPCDEAIHLPNRHRCEMDCFASLAMTLIGRRVGKRRTADATAMHGVRPFASVDWADSCLHSGGNQCSRRNRPRLGGNGR
jgi:hypothetical protein